MFSAFAAWRTLAHLSAWSGLSIGALVGLGLLAWYVAPVRRLAITGALVVVALWIGLLHGDAVGRADLQTQWNAARLAAAAAAAKRDADAQAELDARYQPMIADLQSQADDRKQQVDDYERKMLSMVAAGSCELGVDALRLRRPHH